MMDIKLKCSLVDALDKWINSHCEDNTWPEIYIDLYTSTRMATSIEAMIDNMSVSTKHGDDDQPT